MTSTTEPVLLTLARAATALDAAAVPPDVLRLARLAHLAAAGARRAAAATGFGKAWRAPSAPGAPPGGARAERAARAATDAGLLARHWADDPQLGGRVNLGALPAAWAWAGEGRLGALLGATVAAHELAGRVGLAAVAAPRAAEVAGWVPALAAGVVMARLEGLPPEELARAAAATLQGARRRGLLRPLAALDPAPEALGADAVHAALYGLAAPGSLLALDEGQPVWGELCGRPLRGALDPARRPWLLRTLVVSPTPGALAAQVGVQAVAEILTRHVKAADKRLRADQVEKIELSVPFPAWAAAEAAAALTGPGSLGTSLPRLLGLLVAHHELTPALLEGEDSSRAEDAAWVASTVVVRHDWPQSFAMVRALAEAAPETFGGLGAGDYRAIRAQLKAAGGWPRWTPAEVPTALQARPDRVLRAVMGRGAAAEPFRWHLPVRVRLYTNRGGWWPERRGLPRGTVAGGDLEAAALARFGDDDRARRLLDAPLDMPAAEWVGELLT